ncbi:MAG: hypothetical protein RL538_168 [Candidatus Parcubacteria bacterium]|jgi:hypothetical protein
MPEGGNQNIRNITKQNDTLRPRDAAVRDDKARPGLSNRRIIVDTKPVPYESEIAVNTPTNERYAQEAYQENLLSSQTRNVQTMQRKRAENEESEKRRSAPSRSKSIESVLRSKPGIKKAVSDIRKIIDDENEVILVSKPPKMPSFPILIVLMAIFKDVIDFLNLTIIAAPIPIIASFIVGMVLFFWVLGKASGGWWKKKLIKWLWKRYVIALVVELIPLVNIVPTTTIFILLAHYREKKIVKAINLALEQLRKAGFAEIRE